MRSLVFIVIVAGLLVSCEQSKKRDKKELVVYCASSLTDVVSEISTDFEKDTGWKVRLNLASSGTLARQIEHGATPSIFISANQKWLDYLNKLGKTIPETSVGVAANQMVLVAPVNSDIQTFEFTPEIKLPELFNGRISIGDPQHVPAGSYAVQIFKNLNCEKEMEPRILPAKDVRSALIVVELGEVDAGVVYKTDALKSQKVKILTAFPDSLHSPVIYYMALVKGSENENSLQLYNYIVSEKALQVWEKYGFIR